MSVEITWQPKKAYKKFYGFITGSELISSIEYIMEDIRFDSLRQLINDFSAITGHYLSKDMLSLYSAYLIGSNYNNRVINITFITPGQFFIDLLNRNLEPELFEYFNISYIDTASQKPVSLNG